MLSVKSVHLISVQSCTYLDGDERTFTVLSCEFLKTRTSVVFQMIVASSIVLARTIITIIHH